MSIDELRRRAAELDAADPVAALRDRFRIPEGVVHLTGNSLGPMPAHAPEVARDVIEQQWGTDLIRSWNLHDWWDAPTRVGDRIARLIGVGPDRVVVGDSTSVNLFKVFTAATRLRAGRRLLVTDPASFPTDLYIAESAAAIAGWEVVRVGPPDIPALLDERGDEVGLVAVSSVDYRTGEAWDVAGITAAAHEVGALATVDLCHSVGALDLQLEADDVDFAVGCTYKYLNGGPGSPAFLYVAGRHLEHFDHALTGWHGHAEPFAMSEDFDAAPGITRGRVGTPPLLSLLTLEAGLDVFDDTTMADVRVTSLSLTGLFIDAVTELLPELQIVTPREPERRGSQVSMRHPDAFGVVSALIARDFLADFREPDIVRLGFAAPFITHENVVDTAVALREVLDAREHLDPRHVRGTVT